MQWKKSWMLWFSSDSLKNLTGTRYRAPYPQLVKTFWDVRFCPHSVRNIWWNYDVIFVCLKVKFCWHSRCPVREKRKRKIHMLFFLVNYRYIKSSCLYVQVSDPRRFQIMIRVPVFPNGVEVMASTSSCSALRVWNGEYCRMSCRLALCSSLTHSKVEVKDEPSCCSVIICQFRLYFI